MTRRRMRKILKKYRDYLRHSSDLPTTIPPRRPSHGGDMGRCQEQGCVLRKWDFSKAETLRLFTVAMAEVERAELWKYAADYSERDDEPFDQFINMEETPELEYRQLQALVQRSWRKRRPLTNKFATFFGDGPPVPARYSAVRHNKEREIKAITTAVRSRTQCDQPSRPCNGTTTT